MQDILQRSNGSPPEAHSTGSLFCSRDVFLLHDNARAQKAESVYQILTQKIYNFLSPPVLSRFISARLFSVPQVVNEVKRTQLCRCC